MGIVEFTLQAEDSHVTVNLPDGRSLDIFPSGNVQVYTADGLHGTEVLMPSGETLPADGLRVHQIG
jgi:hypothetical protein